MSAPATRIADLPGPRGLPLLGNAVQLRDATRFHLVAEEWARRYGPIYRFDIGRRRFVAIADPEAINEILRDRPEGYRRWTDQRRVIEEMNGRGVFIAEGEEWRRQRRLVVTALNTHHLHRYFDVIRTATERLGRRLAQSAATAESFEISEALGAYTVDVTSALAFGHDVNTLEGREGSDLPEHVERVFLMTGRRTTAAIPYWRWFRLPADRALDRSIDAMEAAVAGFIARARTRMQANPSLFEEPTNLLEGLLAAQRAEGTFSDDEIRGNVFTVLLAGEDTTSNSLAWTIWLLASRPDMQERLAAEAREALGDGTRPIAYEDVEPLAYTEAALRESMRLKGVAPINGVEPTEDTTVCGVRIPADTRLLLLTRLAGLGDAHSDEFLPERWLEDGDESTHAPKSLAFGAGPRFCPGRNLAFLEAKVALATIVRDYELHVDESAAPVEESLEFTMGPRGLRVRLRARRARIAAGV